MRRRMYRICFKLVVGLVPALIAAACRPSEPPPTLYENLGTEERPLLPTASVWLDPAIAKGTSDWHSFRKPEPQATPSSQPDAATAAAPADNELVGEIREVLDEFNAVVAEGKNDEIADFLIEEQAGAAKQVVAIQPRFAAKLAELADALPGNNENLKKVASALTVARVLRLDVTDVGPEGASEAVGQVSSGQKVRFLLVKEDDEEYWYIDHPQIRAMSPSLPALEQSIQQLDALISGIKSGQISEEIAKQQAAAMDQMLRSLMPPGGRESSTGDEAEPTKDEESADTGGD